MSTKNYKNVHSNLQFIDKLNLDTFIYQVMQVTPNLPSR